MKKEDKDLLLKDLCARLPYGVKIVIQDTFKYSIVSREYHILDISNFSDIYRTQQYMTAVTEKPGFIYLNDYIFVSNENYELGDTIKFIIQPFNEK